MSKLRPMLTWFSEVEHLPHSYKHITQLLPVWPMFTFTAWRF